MKCAIWIAVTGCLLVCLTAASSLGGDEPQPKPAPPADDPFAGKALMIYAKEPAKGAMLEKVKIKQLGNRSFLVGKTIDKDAESRSHWTGVTMWVAIDDVTEIIEFKSADEAREAFVELEKKRSEPK